MINEKFQSVTKELTRNSYRTTITYQGNESELTEFAKSNPIGKINSENGTLKATKFTRGAICEYEEMYERSADGGKITGPDEEFGKKTATLSTSLIPMPLESLDNYLACWNHYLLGKVSDSPKIPGWSLTATNTTLSAADAAKYKWVKELGGDTEWFVLQDPTKPGVESVDKAVYTLTENIKCRSLSDAVKKISNMLNKITSPISVGLQVEGNWKCDSATVDWNGKYWVARLTYTLSGDAQGWDPDLYG